MYTIAYYTEIKIIIIERVVVPDKVP